MVVNRLQADHAMNVTVELFVDGKQVKSHTEKYDRNFEGERKFTNVCRTGFETCVRLTFHGEKTFSSNGQTSDKGAQCLILTQVGTTQIRALVDTTGMGFLGSVCADSNEDLFTFTCPNSEKVKFGSCDK